MPPRPPVKFPFETTTYNYFQMWRDPFTKRKFNENSRIVQIEGNVGAGKHEFANKLAQELDMHVMPDVDVDDYYINEHGFNYTALNPLLPERMRNCDMEMFHENPARHSVIHMQYYMYKMRFLQYLKALRHLFNTGQGVILIRSVWTERVFVEAMHNIGWLPTGYTRGDGVQFYDWKDRYLYSRNMSLSELLRPHLTFYLDTPVDKCLERIKSNSDPKIAESKALVPEFLEAIEKAYEDVVLNSADYYGHVYHVNHKKISTPEEIEDILDDIAPIVFEYDHKDTRYKGWFPDEVWLWYLARRREFTTLRAVEHGELINQPWYDIAGLGDSISHVDLKLRNAIHDGHVGPVGFDYKIEHDPAVKDLREYVANTGTFDGRMKRYFKTDFL